MKRKRTPWPMTLLNAFTYSLDTTFSVFYTAKTMKTLSTLDGFAGTNMIREAYLKLETLLCGGVFKILGCEFVSHQLKIRDQRTR